MAATMTRGANNAASGWLSAPSTSRLNITDALTLSCRFFFTGSPSSTSEGLISKWLGSGSNNRSYVLALTTARKLNFSVSSSGSFQAGGSIDSATTVGAGWNHAAAVFIPSTSVCVYLNGASDGLNTSSVPSTIFSGSAALQLGCQFFANADANAYTAALNGGLAEVAIYAGALSAADIASLAAGASPKLVTPQLLRWYSPLVRSFADRSGGATPTGQFLGATVSNHPRVYG